MCVIAFALPLIAIFGWAGLLKNSEKFFVQLGMIFSMLLIIAVWIMHARDIRDRGVLLQEDESVFLLGTGVACVLLGSLYKSLPVDLIPDFIPVIGKLDDEFIGGGLQFLGLTCSVTAIYLEFSESESKMKSAFGIR